MKGSRRLVGGRWSAIRQDEGEVGDCSRHEHLEEGLTAAEVSGLANTELGHPGNAVLYHLTLFSEVVEGRTLLPLLGRLDHCFLGMQLHLTPFPSGAEAFAPERTGGTDGGGECSCTR